MHCVYTHTHNTLSLLADKDVPKHALITICQVRFHLLGPSVVHLEGVVVMLLCKMESNEREQHHDGPECAEQSTRPGTQPVFLSSFSAWALVDSGWNVQARSSYSGGSPRVIVSRSHEGKATRFIQRAFGNATVVHAAGGAGTVLLLPDLFIYFINTGADPFQGSTLTKHTSFNS